MNFSCVIEYADEVFIEPSPRPEKVVVAGLFFETQHDSGNAP